MDDNERKVSLLLPMIVVILSLVNGKDISNFLEHNFFAKTGGNIAKEKIIDELEDGYDERIDEIEELYKKNKDNYTENSSNLLESIIDFLRQGKSELKNKQSDDKLEEYQQLFYSALTNGTSTEKLLDEKLSEFTYTPTTGSVELPADLVNLQAKDLFKMGTIANNHSDPNDQEGAKARKYIFDTIAALVNVAHSKYPMKKSLVIAQCVLECGWVHETSSPLVRDYNNILSVNDWGGGELTSPYTTWYKKGQKTATTMMSHPGGATNDPAKVYDNLYEAIEDYMGQFIYHHPEETFGDYDNLYNYKKYLGGYTEEIPGWGNNIVGYYEYIIKKYGLEKYDQMPDTELSSDYVTVNYDEVSR